MTISPFITPRLGKGRTDEKTDGRTNASMVVFVSDDISTHERLKTEDVPLHARLHPGRVRGRLTTRALARRTRVFGFRLFFSSLRRRARSRTEPRPSRGVSRRRPRDALGIARTPSVVGRAGAFIPGRLDRIGSGRADRVLDVRSASGLGDGAVTTTTTTTSANERTTSAFGAAPRGVDRSPVQTSPSPSPHPPVGARSFSHTTHGSYLQAYL